MIQLRSYIDTRFDTVTFEMPSKNEFLFSGEKILCIAVPVKKTVMKKSR